MGQKGKGKGKGKSIKGDCWKCGKPGHMAADCKSKGKGGKDAAKGYGNWPRGYQGTKGYTDQNKGMYGKSGGKGKGIYGMTDDQWPTQWPWPTQWSPQQQWGGQESSAPQFLCALRESPKLSDEEEHAGMQPLGESPESEVEKKQESEEKEEEEEESEDEDNKGLDQEAPSRTKEAEVEMMTKELGQWFKPKRPAKMARCTGSDKGAAGKTDTRLKNSFKAIEETNDIPGDGSMSESVTPPPPKMAEVSRMSRMSREDQVAKMKKVRFVSRNCCKGEGCKGEEVSALFEDQPEVLSPLSTEIAPPKWEILSVTVDSGAADSVIPEDRCTQYEAVDTQKSLAGASYSGADGSKIPNLGERTINAVTEDGRDAMMRFQVCPVTKALGSVSKMVKNGHRVVFDDPDTGEGSYILDRRTGRRTYLRQENGVFVLDVWVKPRQSVVKDSSQRGVVSHNLQGGVHQSGNSTSSHEAAEHSEQIRDEMTEDEEEDVRPIKAETTPRTPTAEEYRVHRLTHLPYRSWCPHCVRGKKKNPPHRKQSKSGDGDRSIPVIAIDYMFMTSRDAEKSNPIIVIKDSKNDGVWAFMALRKGSTNTYIAERIAKVINFMGYKKCTIRCDQEPAMKDLQKEVRKELWEEKVKTAREVVDILGKERVEIIEPQSMN
eukprot:12431137-Karenia_brevis.AAC.1